MQLSEVWKTTIQPGGSDTPVYAIAIKPNRPEILIGQGSRLNVHNIFDGTLIESLKKHRHPIFSIGVSHQSPTFATAGTDGIVIIWNSDTNKGLYKFQINGPSSCLTFSPTDPILLSCAGTEFTTFNVVETKRSSPIQTSDRILCGAWSPNGRLFAIGHISGTVSVRSIENSQQIFTAHLQIPVFATAWSGDILCAGDWDNQFSCYKPITNEVLKKSEIPAPPTNFLNFESNLLVSDISGNVLLFNDEGLLLSKITNIGDWIWSMTINKEGYFGVGLNNGTVAVYGLGLKPIYSLFGEYFALRTEITKINIFLTGTDLKEEVEFVKPIQGVSINQNFISIRFFDEVSVYQYFPHESSIELNKECRFDTNFHCNFFFSFCKVYVFVFEKTVKLLSASGAFIRDISFGSVINYACVYSTFVGREGILLGLADGGVYQLFVNHRFAHVLLKHSHPVKHLDISQMKTKLSVIDDENKCYVYSIADNVLLFIQEDVTTSCWNELTDDVVSFSDGNVVKIKAFELPSTQIPYRGQLFRFRGLTVFVISDNMMTQKNISLANAVRNLVRNGNFVKGYQLAALGSTEDEWNLFADFAIRAKEFFIAIKAAAHAKNTHLLHFIEMLQTTGKGLSEEALNAEVDAWLGDYDSAARTWNKLQQNERALQMYFDLRQFEKLKVYLSGDRMKQFALKQAKNFEEKGDFKLAAELFIAGGESLSAVELLGEKKMIEVLIQLAKGIDHSEILALQTAAKILMDNNRIKEGTDLLSQLNDVASLAKVRVVMKDWDEALSLAKMHPDLLPEVFLPFAQYLFEDDQYIESLVSFFIAGKVDEAIKSLNTLIDCSLMMNKFTDVAFFFYGRCLGQASQSENAEHAEAIVRSGMMLARAYSAFGRLRDDMSLPFTSKARNSAFTLSRFIVAYMNSIRNGKKLKQRFLHQITDRDLEGLDFARVLYALMSECAKNGNYKLMKWCAKRLAHYAVPETVREATDLLLLRLKHAEDTYDGDFCQRCGTKLFISKEGPFLWCSYCETPIVFSCWSFRVLPMFQFYADLKLSPKGAVELIKEDPPHNVNSEDIFGKPEQGSGIQTLNALGLQSLDPNSVIVGEWKEASKVKTQFFFNPMFVHAYRCRGCNSLFDDIDSESTYLINGACPLCKTPVDVEFDKEYAESFDSYSELLKQLRDFSENLPIYF